MLSPNQQNIAFAAVLTAGTLFLLATQDAPLPAPSGAALGAYPSITWRRPVHPGPAEVETTGVEQAGPGCPGWARAPAGQAVVPAGPGVRSIDILLAKAPHRPPARRGPALPGRRRPQPRG